MGKPTQPFNSQNRLNKPPTQPLLRELSVLTRVKPVIRDGPMALSMELPKQLSSHECQWWVALVGETALDQ